MERHTLHPSSVWYGSRVRTLHEFLAVRYGSFGLEWIVLCAAVVTGFMRLGAFVRMRQPDPRDVAFLYLLIQYLFILALMSVNWGRYYLPTVMAAQILVAITLRHLGAWIWHVAGTSGNAEQAALADPSPVTGDLQILSDAKPGTHANV
jgi:hypothetical protein